MGFFYPKKERIVLFASSISTFYKITIIILYAESVKSEERRSNHETKSCENFCSQCCKNYKRIFAYRRKFGILPYSISAESAERTGWIQEDQMIGKCAERIADWLVGNNVIQTKEKEVYVYGAYSLVVSILPLAMALVFGCLMKCPVRAVLVILPFVFLRKYSGGFHVKQAWVCMTGSSILLVVCIKCSFLLTHAAAVVFLSAYAAVSLILCSPLDNENRRLTISEKRHCKKITVRLALGFLLLILLCETVGNAGAASCMSVGMILSAWLQYPCLIEKILPKNAVSCRFVHSLLQYGQTLDKINYH